MFSNGTGYMMFLEAYCFRCGKYKEDQEGLPARNSCKIEKQIALSGWGLSEFPKEIYIPEHGIGHSCTEFISKEDFNRKRKPHVRKTIKGQLKIGE